MDEITTIETGSLSKSRRKGPLAFPQLQGDTKGCPNLGRHRGFHDSVGQGPPKPAWRRRTPRGQRGHHTNHRAVEGRQQLPLPHLLPRCKRWRPEPSRTVRMNVNQRRRQRRTSSVDSPGQQVQSDFHRRLRGSL